MKIRLLLLLIAFVYLCTSYAQSIDTLKVYQKYNVNNFLLSEIDSLSHTEDFVSIHGKESISNYSTNEIDSIVIKQGNGECYSIPEEQLNGWDEGVYYTDYENEDNSFFVVSHTDKEEGTKTVYLDRFGNTDITQSLIMVFSPNSEIQDIFISGFQFEAHTFEDYVTFVAYDKQGNTVDCFDVPYEEGANMLQSRIKGQRRAIEHYRIVNIRNFLGKAGKTMWTVGGITLNLQDGKYGDILKDYLIGQLAGKFTKAFLKQLTIAELIDLYLKQLYENNKNWFLGGAGIEITSIKRTSKSTISVEGEISNISTIPKNRIVIADGVQGTTQNVVWYGVAEGKSGQPGLYLNDNCSNLAVVSDSHFTRTINVEYQPGQTFYFRPFLIPETKLPDSEGSLGDNIKNRLASCIRYGKIKEYTDILPSCSTGEVVKTTDKSAIVKCYYGGAEWFNCGVAVSGKNGTMTFSTSNEDGEHEINITGLKAATTYDYWAYINVDGNLVNGEVKSFTTDLPDISGTWNCTEEYYEHSWSTTPKYKTYSISLNSNGSVSCSEYEEIVSGSWSFRSDGTVSISIMILATQTANSGVEWSGTVDSLMNPTTITGSKYNWNYNQIGYFQGDSHSIVMTR